MKQTRLLTMCVVVIGLAACPNTCVAQEFKYPPCYSIFEAKLRGCYLYPAVCEPSVIVWKGKQIKIKEAWVEQAHERLLLWSKKISRYNLCINLATGWDVLWDITGKVEPPFFVLEGQRKGFGMMGSAVLWETFERIDSDEFTVLLTNNWDFDGAIKINVKAVKPGSAQKK